VEEDREKRRRAADLAAKEASEKEAAKERKRTLASDRRVALQDARKDDAKAEDARRDSRYRERHALTCARRGEQLLEVYDTFNQSGKGSLSGRVRVTRREMLQLAGMEWELKRDVDGGEAVGGDEFVAYFLESFKGGD